MGKISLDQAQQEVQSWLDYKKITDREREKMQEFEDVLIDNIVDGHLSLDEKYNFHYNMKFPVMDEDGNEALSELTFKPRLDVLSKDKALRGVKSDDSEGRQIAYVSALTDKAKGLLKKMDTEDNKVCTAIIMYFL